MCNVGAGAVLRGVGPAGPLGLLRPGHCAGHHHQGQPEGGGQAGALHPLLSLPGQYGLCSVAATIATATTTVAAAAAADVLDTTIRVNLKEDIKPVFYIHCCHSQVSMNYGAVLLLLLLLLQPLLLLLLLLMMMMMMMMCRTPPSGST